MKPPVDLPEEELETKINQWNLDEYETMFSNDANASSEDASFENKVNKKNVDEVKDRIVEPEHFDKTSILTDSNETFMTEEKRYKYAPSASTRYVETHSEVETPSIYFAKKTTLLLLACRIRKWPLVETLLDTYTPNPNHKDAEGSNALHLVIKANNADMCTNIIYRVHKNELKSEVNIDGKNALKLMTEMILDGTAHIEFDYLEKKVLQITGQKQNPCRKTKPKNKSELLATKMVQKLRLFRGQTCGFFFESLKPPIWTCRGNNCAVELTIDQDFSFKDLNHSRR